MASLATPFKPTTGSLDLAAWRLPGHGINQKRIPRDVDVLSLGTTSASSPDGEACEESGRCTPSVESNDGPEFVSAGEFTAQAPWMSASVSSTSGVDRRAALRQHGHEVLTALKVSQAPSHRGNHPDKKRTLLQVSATPWSQRQPDRAATLSWLEGPTASNVPRTERPRFEASTSRLAAFRGSSDQVWYSDGVVFSL